jgi:hypothetical protein
MFKIDALAILVVGVLTVGILLLPPAATKEMDLATFVSDGLARTLLSICTIVAMPLAFMMPRLRAGFIGRSWKVPSSTYLLPRWIVQFGIGAMLGQVIGVLVLAILKNHHLFWLAGSFSLIGGAFCAGAWRRLSKHPNTEFSTRWWPRI